MMVYVERRAGRIIGVYANLQPGFADEGLAEDHPDVVAFRSPPPTTDDVVAERERRMSVGFNHDFGDARGVHRIGTTDADLKGWDEVTTLAAALIVTGLGASTIVAVTDTGPVEISALEWQEILIAAGAFRQPIWAASFALQAMTPIPPDFSSDLYWPAID